MKTAERIKPILVVEDEVTMSKPYLNLLTDDYYHVDTTDERERALQNELSLWDEEGKMITKQIITRFPHLFPWFPRA